MQLTKWDPFRELEDMFDRYTRPLGKLREQVTGADWAPRVDIAETDKAFTIKAELPEVKKEDVKVKVENGVLTLNGERKQEKEEKNKKFHRVERFYGSFLRSFTLPENIDENGIKAAFKDGMLVLEIPKTETVKPKSIDIAVR